MSASASKDGSCRYVAVINRSADEDVEAVLAVDSELVDGPVTVHTLGADAQDLFAVNTLSSPDVLGIRESTRELTGGVFVAPARSVSVVSWEVVGAAETGSLSTAATAAWSCRPTRTSASAPTLTPTAVPE